MQKEVFKDIPGYEGLYQVSNLGNVKSLPKKWIAGNGTVRNSNSKILKPGIDSSGYYSVGLSLNFKSKTINIHKLVAITFLNYIPSNNEKLVVDHIDNNKLNNCLKNLQLITHRENCSKGKLLKIKTSKYTGVIYHIQCKKWISRIQINKKNIHIGLFKTEEEAHLAYINKLKEIQNE
jgi:hypothetical protein